MQMSSGEERADPGILGYLNSDTTSNSKDVTIKNVTSDLPPTYYQPSILIHLITEEQVTADILPPYQQQPKITFEDLPSAHASTDSLMQAASKGLIEDVKLLLESGADVNQVMSDGTMPLMVAAQNGHLEIVKLLIKHKADVNAAREDGATSVLVASQNGHTEVAIFLIEKGAEINWGTDTGATPLLVAIENGHLKIAEILVQGEADVNKATTDGRTSLMAASWFGHHEIVTLLLENGADIHWARESGDTPLLMASQNGHIEVVKLLLEHGADIHREHETGWTPFISASQNGHIEVVKLLLEHGADFHRENKPGVTPLNIASQNGHIEVVKLLLEHGADIQRASETGLTPLYIASLNGHIEVVRLLLEHGADIHRGHETGWTPLLAASQNGHIEVVKLLLEHGADIHRTNEAGWTPLIVASLNGHIEVVKLLLEHGADIHRAGETGWTSLIAASQNGHIEVVKLLLEHGADIHQVDESGWTPLLIASQHGHLEVVGLLVAKGAEVHVQSKDGTTPLQTALEQGHHEVIQLLSSHIAMTEAQADMNASILSGGIDHICLVPAEAIAWLLDHEDFLQEARSLDCEVVPDICAASQTGDWIDMIRVHGSPNTQVADFVLKLAVMSGFPVYWFLNDNRVVEKVAGSDVGNISKTNNDPQDDLEGQGETSQTSADQEENKANSSSDKKGKGKQREDESDDGNREENNGNDQRGPPSESNLALEAQKEVKGRPHVTYFNWMDNETQAIQTYFELGFETDKQKIEEGRFQNRIFATANISISQTSGSNYRIGMCTTVALFPGKGAHRIEIRHRPNPKDYGTIKTSHTTSTNPTVSGGSDGARFSYNKQYTNTKEVTQTGVPFYTKSEPPPPVDVDATVISIFPEDSFRSPISLPLEIAISLEEEFSNDIPNIDFGAKICVRAETQYPITLKEKPNIAMRKGVMLVQTVTIKNAYGSVSSLAKITALLPKTLSSASSGLSSMAGPSSMGPSSVGASSGSSSADQPTGSAPFKIIKDTKPGTQLIEIGVAELGNKAKAADLENRALAEAGRNFKEKANKSFKQLVKAFGLYNIQKDDEDKESELEQYMQTLYKDTKVKIIKVLIEEKETDQIKAVDEGDFTCIDIIMPPGIGK
ncbi:hypothetical protein D9758_010081 [Tetrapyrgos nigripes]|uniref:Uncharacterized protein n=1 Tax=Tetrapyrgos nigripes TaxID=182062 RepID=A0A8H5CSC3_9AGAR|nr:hypothetical protein D9758_010081 [Tetrapyrgos nigripes]